MRLSFRLLMAINPIKHGEEVLYTVQHHVADRAGPHNDVRLVVGDKAYSWSSFKDMPTEGKSIVLWSQPVHTSSYALSPEVEIPAGNYGAGHTKLIFVRKAHIESHEDGTMVMHVKGGERYLLKKLDGEKYGKGWLFKNLGPKKEQTKEASMSNKYLEKIAAINIDPKNKGKLHAAMHEPEGKKLSTSSEESVKAKAKKSGNVKLEREAQFAINAKSWVHKK